MLTAILLALVAQDCPPGVDVRACTRLDRCVVAHYVTRTASVGVSAVEAALVTRLDVEHACALAGWAEAVTSTDTEALRKKAPTACPPCLTAAPVEPRPLFVDVLSHGAAAAVGAAIGAGAGYAACKASVVP